MRLPLEVLPAVLTLVLSGWGLVSFAAPTPPTKPDVTSSVSTAGRARGLQEAETRLDAGHPEQAIRILERLVPGAPPAEASDLHLRIADILARGGNREAAVSRGFDAIAAWPDNGWLYLRVARMLAEAGRPVAAENLVIQGQARDPVIALAAQEFIVALHTPTPVPLSSPSTPVPPGTGRLDRWIIFLALGLGLAGAGGGWFVARRSRASGSAPVGRMPGGADVAQGPGRTVADPLATGPIQYAPVGVHVRQPGERIGPYRILRLVVSSLHSVLYCAWDERLQRQVALKHVSFEGASHPAVMARFEKEVRSLAALSDLHEGVARVYDLLEPGIMVTEWIDGDNLDGTMELAVDEVIDIGIRVLEVLALAHVRGIVHRDIKPSNLMRSADSGRVKVLDFGIAKNAQLGTTLLTVDAGVPVGTFAYMPPEQFANPHQVTAQADLYATGLTLYRLIAGRMPAEPWLGPRSLALLGAGRFRSVSLESPALARYVARTGMVPDASWLEQLDACLVQAFAERPEDRFADAHAMAQVLRALLGRLAEGLHEEIPAFESGPVGTRKETDGEDPAPAG